MKIFPVPVIWKILQDAKVTILSLIDRNNYNWSVEIIIFNASVNFLNV